MKEVLEKLKKSGFYQPPFQRQKWGDTQVLPHVNWGDLFFDLFYVAAAYNLATILKTDKNWESFFYFLACFGPVYTHFWNMKTIYDARFGLPNDVVHPVFEVFQLCALATAVLHIKPTDQMSHPADNHETFMFCLANFFGTLHSIIFNAEIKYIWVDGVEEAAKHQAGKDLGHNVVTMLINAAAAVYAGLLYYTDIGTHDVVYHGPMIIMIVGWLTKPFILYFFYVHFAHDDFKRFSVPINIGFVIHRMGEWTMLMLGESVLSLLIVNDVSDYAQANFYTVFYLGIVSVTLLQILYFKSQPHSADQHAMRRTRLSGMFFNFFIQLYSASLIIVGVGYKMLLTEYTSDYAVKDSDSDGDSYGTDGYTRSLAGSSSALKYSTAERQQRIAWIFGLGLGSVFICLDLLTMAHNGIDAGRARCNDPETGKFNFKGFFIVVVSRLLIMGFVMTFSLYYSEPHGIAWFGLATIIMQVSRNIHYSLFLSQYAYRYEYT
jgi:low temperature requirement protein LtrA